MDLTGQIQALINDADIPNVIVKHVKESEYCCIITPLHTAGGKKTYRLRPAYGKYEYESKWNG